MAVEVFDTDGKNIEHLGQPGELVCTRPHPSLPVAFWGDEDGEKLRNAYFDFYPGIWRQGDFIVVNPSTKGLMILGRRYEIISLCNVPFLIVWLVMESSILRAYASVLPKSIPC